MSPAPEPQPRVVCRACFERNQRNEGAAARRDVVMAELGVELRCVEHGLVAAWVNVRFTHSENAVVVTLEGRSVKRCPHCSAAAPAANVRALRDPELTFCQACKRWGRWA